MSEEPPTPSMDWDYELIDGDGEVVDLSSRLRRRKNEGALAPGSGWHIEFRGRLLSDELILARYLPSDDQDAREWLTAFESGKISTIPVGIDAYEGPCDDPEEEFFEHDDELDNKDDDLAEQEEELGEEEEGDPEDDPKPVWGHPGADFVNAGHTIYIGHGLLTRHETNFILTIPPVVFRDAALSLLLNFGSQYAHIEQRIFRVFAAIDPEGHDRFLSAVNRIRKFPLLDKTEFLDTSQKPTFEHAYLTSEQMIDVLSLENGRITFRQLYLYLQIEDRVLRKWLERAEVVEKKHDSLAGRQFTSSEILNTFVPWLRDYKRKTHGANTFLYNLVVAKLIDR